MREDKREGKGREGMGREGKRFRSGERPLALPQESARRKEAARGVGREATCEEEGEGRKVWGGRCEWRCEWV